MLYNRNYPALDDNMTNFSVGARKEKSCLINIFASSAIINDVVKDPRREAINVQTVDYTQIFDSLKLRKCLISLINGGVANEEAIMIYNLNKEISMAVKNNDEVSKITKVVDVILQGDTMAPLLASLDLDTLVKDWIQVAGPALYKYRGSVPVPCLGMMDDLLFITKVGVDMTRANSFLNVTSAVKGVQFSESKCANMVVVNKKNDVLENVVKIDTWKEVRETDNIKDEFVGQSVVKNVDM